MPRCSYNIDPSDPRAPSAAEWDALSAAERQWVVDQLPSEVPRETMPEGDPHRTPKEKAMEALKEYFRRLGRRIYLSAELPVYYPAEPMFAPDLIAMLDVDPRERLRWVVSHEGKGLDFALEITLSGDRRKDLELNVDRFARLGIPEYFVLDLKYHRILGYRLGAAMSYEPIVPQLGRWPSRVLGLDLGLEHDRVRFYSGSARLPDSEELIGRLEGMVDTLVAKEEALAQFEAEKARTEEEKARAEEERARANRLAARLRELGVEVDES